MSDRIAVFNDGRIEQIGAPAERLRAPRERVRRRLRRRLERARARTGRPLHRAAGEDPHARRGRAARRRATTSRTASIREVVYVGMVTRYVVDLDAGGALTVVRQNLETSSSEALEAARPPRAARVAARAHLRNRTGGEDGGERMKRTRRRLAAPRRARGAAGRARVRRRELRRRRRRAGGAAGRRDWQIEGLGTTLEEIQEKAREEGEVNLIQWAGLRAADEGVHSSRPGARSTRRTAPPRTTWSRCSRRASTTASRHPATRASA